MQVGTFPAGTTLSYLQNGSRATANLPVVIASIAPAQAVTVTFKASAASVPAVNPVFNVARADYEFFPFAGYPAVSFSNSNPASVFIVDRAITNVKSVDKAFAVKGDLLTYTSVITNNGNIPVTDVFFRDPIPAGTTFVASSVQIDGAAYPVYDPQIGFVLADLPSGASVTVEFDVEVN